MSQENEKYQSALEYVESRLHNIHNAEESPTVDDLIFDLSLVHGKLKLEEVSTPVEIRVPDLEDMESLKIQVDGSHYKDMGIQPWVIIMMNKLDFWEGNALKYLLRYKTKNGVVDLKKILHYVQYLIEREEKKNG
jgi:hypothetical protein